jgi:hypothetical protein
MPVVVDKPIRVHVPKDTHEVIHPRWQCSHCHTWEIRRDVNRKQRVYEDWSREKFFCHQNCARDYAIEMEKDTRTGRRGVWHCDGCHSFEHRDTRKVTSHVADLHDFQFCSLHCLEDKSHRVESARVKGSLVV